MIRELLRSAAYPDEKTWGIVNMTALHIAAQEGRVESARVLLAGGAQIDILVRSRNNFCCGDYTALHLAALGGHLDVVKHLVEEGADVHVKCQDDDCPRFSRQRRP